MSAHPETLDVMSTNLTEIP